jgi:hypothetical protein
LVENAFSLPAESWKEIKLDIPKRKYNKFKVFEHVIHLEKDGHPVREIIIKIMAERHRRFLLLIILIFQLKHVLSFMPEAGELRIKLQNS